MTFTADFLDEIVQVVEALDPEPIEQIATVVADRYAAEFGVGLDGAPRQVEHPQVSQSRRLRQGNRPVRADRRAVGRRVLVDDLRAEGGVHGDRNAEGVGAQDDRQLGIGLARAHCTTESGPQLDGDWIRGRRGLPRAW